MREDSKAGLAGAIASLLAGERMQGVLIEEYSSALGEWHILAMGISGFVEPSTFEVYLRVAQQFSFVDMVCKAATRETLFLGPEEVGSANADGGLDLAVHYMQAAWDFTDARWRHVGALGQTTYVKYHRGYRIRRALQEDWVREPDVYLAAGYTPLHQIHVEAPETRHAKAGGSPRRIVYFADAVEVAKRAPGSSMSYVMRYEDPVCGFSPNEQRILCKAVEGMTDDQIAKDVGVSSNTVKMSWRRIYERVRKARPVVLSEPAGADHAGVRGLEKRRRVIAFVEDHPEEMRRYTPI